MKKILTGAAFAAALAAAWPAGAIEVMNLAPDERITLDGRFDEPAWSRAQLFDRFWELFPKDQVAARVRTEVRFAHDAQALYVAIRAFDPDTSQLRAPFARRDKVLSDQDMLVLFIDPV